MATIDHRLLLAGRGIDALDPMLLYLCSDASRFVTGAAFTVDDGQSL
jgi:NAD(P)-dependent dehydrogenase (short-subunit alcohol dehydrogenase family)